ncbi:hypothetical protein OSK10_27875, partial [Escherichia coli]|nr:hypothetical protein [Escherichia coli]
MITKSGRLFAIDHARTGSTKIVSHKPNESIIPPDHVLAAIHAIKIDSEFREFCQKHDFDYQMIVE